MRKYIKEEILQLIESLHQAHDEIRTAIDSQSFSSVQNMLSECQECALHLGMIIEQSEGEGFITVSYLEKYCERLFEVFEGIQEDIRVEKAIKMLKKALLQVENSAKYDIPVRKEVVFFPYKASMWDALESVYLKLKEEDECDVYCVPIPYYERNADRTLGKMCYEGNDYPSNIEVFDWRSYKLDERKPDTVYIHNPYDDTNFVTCVHPDYFSKNLKKYTSELIYIPYFVHGDIANQQVIDKMKRFCTFPGVINADKVILQSENIRQIYINEYIKAFEEIGVKLNRNAIEKKFIGSGSPKVDKILRTKKEDLEIPESWLEVIQKSDGSWKKIVFYNTSITSLLKADQQMLKKMKHVFEIFKQHRDTVALLWRPHPLIQTTIKSMRPHLWAEYEKLVEQYKLEAWGIYDDTPDMPRAVILSDAYYGDSSSVLQLYRETGKPIMMQNMQLFSKACIEAEQKVSIEIEDAVIHEGKVWFCAKNFNSLFVKDIITDTTRLVGVFPNETYAGQRLYGSMQLVGRKICFTPFSANSIAVYDLDKDEFQSITFDKKYLPKNGNQLAFMGSVVYQQYVYLLPALAQTIIRLDLDNMSLEYLTDWTEKISDIVFDPQDAFFRQQLWKDGKICYVPFCNANAVLELDCENANIVIHRIGTEPYGYSGISGNGEKFWLSPRNSSNITVWNRKTNIVEFITELDGKRTLESVVGLVADERYIKLFLKNPEQYSLHSMRGEYNFVKEHEDRYICYECYDSLLVINEKNGSEEMKIKIDVDCSDIAMEKIIAPNVDILFELKECNLRHLLFVMQSMR